MANEPLAWLLTYVIHSTLLLGGAWLLSVFLPDRARVVRETTWKVALVGAFITASFQVAESTPVDESQIQPVATSGYSGGLTIRLGPPANVSPDADRPTDALIESSAMSDCCDLSQPTRGTSTMDWTCLASDHDVDCCGEQGTHEECAFLMGSAGSALESDPGQNVESGENHTLASRLDRRLAGSAALQQIARIGDALPKGERITVERNLMLGFGALWLIAALFGGFRILRAHFLLRSRIRDRIELADSMVHRVLARLCRRAGVRQKVRLTECDAIAGPMAIGLSEICVPSRALTELSEEELEALLAHELGHLVRRDPLWATISFAVENLFLLQPLNRLARRRIQQEAEYLADDWAIEQTGSRFSLARCLATVAGWVVGTTELRTASAMAGSSSPLVGRVERLLDGNSGRPSRFVRWIRVPVTMGLLLGIALLAPEVTARVARPGATAGAPVPPNAILNGIEDLDRYTIRTEDHDQGILEVRVEDGEVLGVRLDGEAVPENRYSIEDDVLIVEDEEGNAVADVDLDIQSRIALQQGSLAQRLARIPHLTPHGMAGLRDLGIDIDDLRHQIEVEIDTEAIQREIEAARIDRDELRRMIEAEIEVEIDDEELRRALEEADIGMDALRHRIEIESDHDGDHWSLEDEDIDADELRQQLEESFEDQREAIEAHLDELHEELEELDLDEHEELEALEEIGEERLELMEELDRERERAVRRLERDLDRRARGRATDGSDAGQGESGDPDLFARRRDRFTGLTAARVLPGAPTAVITGPAMVGSADGNTWVLLHERGVAGGLLAPGVYSIPGHGLLKIADSGDRLVRIPAYRIDPNYRSTVREYRRRTRDRSERTPTPPVAPLAPDFSDTPAPQAQFIQPNGWISPEPSVVVAPSAEVFSDAIPPTSPAPHVEAVSPHVSTPYSPVAPIAPHFDSMPAPGVATPRPPVTPAAQCDGEMPEPRAD